LQAKFRSGTCKSSRPSSAGRLNSVLNSTERRETLSHHLEDSRVAVFQSPQQPRRRVTCIVTSRRLTVRLQLLPGTKISPKCFAAGRNARRCKRSSLPRRRQLCRQSSCVSSLRCLSRSAPLRSALRLAQLPRRSTPSSCTRRARSMRSSRRNWSARRAARRSWRRTRPARRARWPAFASNSSR